MKDEYGEVTIRLENLPPRIRGFVYHDDDGREFILLNARLTREINTQSADHEIAHILRGEMYDPDYHEYEGGTLS